MMKETLFLLIVIVVAEVWSVSNQFYSSTERLLNLHNVDKQLIEIVQTYLDDEYQEIERLEMYAKLRQLEKESKKGELDNPINSFLLIKRLSVDWLQIHELIEQGPSIQRMLEKTKDLYNIEYPTDNDSLNAALGIEILRTTYELNLTEIANGNLNGVQYDSKLSWEDCLEIGLKFYDNDDKESAIPWLEEALRRRELDKIHTSFTNVELLEYIASCYEEIGNLKKALNVTNEILKLEHNNRFALANKDQLQTKMYLKVVEQIEGVHFNPLLATNVSNEDDDMISKYKQICRKANFQNSSNNRRLYCRYTINGALYRTLSPFKYEEINLEPLLGIYHEVLSTDDVAIMKNLAKPHLVRNLVLSEKDSDEAQYRISQGASFEYKTHPVLMKVYQTIEDITGLDMSSAEKIQISNYGIGGHYGPHFDFFSTDLILLDPNNMGDRIATGMLYLSEVEQGGATAFINLNTATWPETGSLVFWYNLHPSGNPDYNTLHAACPVIKGSKWIANIWLHSHGQEFRRPCNDKLEE